MVTVALDQSFGASFLNCGYFTMHTVILAVLTGNVFPLSSLGSAIVNKVRQFPSLHEKARAVSALFCSGAPYDDTPPA